MKIAWNLLSFFLLHQFAIAQQASYTSFTVNDGLPSNHIYQCLEDDHGFLWIATDAGIARFDGKSFQVFTIEHGLPDNEVLQVVREKNGTIWVNCFKQGPAYFDAIKNRFISAREDSTLRIYGTNNMNLYTLSKGGVQYYNENGATIFKHKTAGNSYVPLKARGFLVKENDDGSTLWWRNSNYKEATRIFHVKNNADLDSSTTWFSGTLNFVGASDDRFYWFRRSGDICVVFSAFSLNPLRYKKDTVRIPEPFFTMAFTETSFYLISNSGKVYVFNKRTLAPEYVISGTYLPNGFYDDSKGNLWICTIDKGLLVYRRQSIRSLEMPAGFSRTNFISLAKSGESLLAGNYYGEVVEIKRNKVAVHRIVRKVPSRQRKIIVSGSGLYTISEDGTYLNYTKNISTVGGKTAILYNDSTMLVGTYGGIDVTNTRTGIITKRIRYKRVTAFAKSATGLVYMGSTDGLHSYDATTDSFRSLSYISPLLTDRIAALCTTPDDIVWVATSGRGLVAIKNNAVLAAITIQEGLITNACRSVSTGAAGQVWLGTTQGISVVNYNLNGGKLSYAIQNISKNDGLGSNDINDLLYVNDTMYVATGNGIAAIPAILPVPRFDIPVKIIRMNINQQDTFISDRYQLEHYQQNIVMQFAAIELNGHFKHLQYSLDQEEGWIDLPGRTLTVQLNSGLHIIRVRAVDVNGNLSRNILKVAFDIATPFWKTFWFWLAVAVIVQLLLVFVISRWQRRKKESKLAKEIAVVQTASLEQQAFTSLLNPHFMFNALNSIQHYINVQDRQKANRYLSDFASLIRKNFEAAQQSFISLDQELENARIYLRLEQMRFAGKFSYTIAVDEAVDAEEWMIPTMMLQPLLENAVLHGIMPSAINGEVVVEVKETDGRLNLCITDNGIGIKNSRALKQNNRHKSHGMELIKKRIKALSHFSKDPVTMHMAPAFDSISNPGNRIVIVIPAALHGAWLQVQQKHTASQQSA